MEADADTEEVGREELEVEPKDEERIEVQKKEKEKVIAVLISAFFLSNRLNYSCPATVYLVVANYNCGRDEALRFSELAGRRQTTFWVLAPTFARTVGSEIRLWSHTRP